MNCPVCKEPLASQRGTQLDPTDGWTVYCANRQCEAQEISGHGGTIKDAEKIVSQRRLTSGNNDNE